MNDIATSGERLSKAEFEEFLSQGVVEPFCGNEFTFFNYNDEENGYGIYYNVDTNEFTDLVNIKLTQRQLNLIEDRIIDFYVENKENN